MGKKITRSRDALFQDGTPVFQQEVCVIGAGYVGVVTAAVLASKHPHIRFIVTDIDHEKINTWQTTGPMPINEPGLQDLIPRRNLEFSDDIDDALLLAKIIFIAVGPPAIPAQKALLTVSKSSDTFHEIGAELEVFDKIIAKLAVQRDLERSIVIRSTMHPEMADGLEEIVS